MAEANERKAIGRFVWHDVTVADAPALRDFYASVVGWKPEPVAMGEYSDYVMSQSDGTQTAGVCHARGENANLPPQWILYVTVADLDASMKRCVESGGAVVSGSRMFGEQRYCVVRDPAGAHIGLVQQ